MVETLLLRTLSVCVRNPAAEVLGRAARGAKQATAGAIGNGERQTLLVGDNSTYPLKTGLSMKPFFITGMS